MVDACPIGRDYQHIVAVARTAPVCLGGPRKDGITIYTQWHPHSPGSCSQGKLPTSLVLPCEAGTNFTYNSNYLTMLSARKSTPWRHTATSSPSSSRLSFAAVNSALPQEPFRVF